MITRRILVNLVAFALLAAALIAYGFFDLLGDPLSGGVTVSTVLPSASGLAPNFLVTLDGVDVGTVKSVSLVRNGAKVTMALNPGTSVPADVDARVVIANALGEQEVQLVPNASTSSPGIVPTASATDPASSPGDARLVSRSTDRAESLKNGAVIPAGPDSQPADVGTVVAEATKLLQSIPAGDLDTLLHEAAVALNGNAGNLRTIASASDLFSQEFLAQQQQFEALLSNAPPVLDTVTQNSSALRQGLADTAVLAQVLATHSNDLVRLLGQGSGAASALQSLVTQNEPNLACITYDAAALAGNLGSGANLANVSTALRTNQEFFGAVRSLAVTGPAKALTSKDHSRDDQEWLRTRLMLPVLQVPLQPAPIEYNTPTSLPAVLPGAACQTEFGAGAGAATQAGFHPVGPDAKVVAPTASEAQVRGGGTEPVSAAPSEEREPLGPSPVLPALLAGLVLLGWMLMLGHRSVARSARPLRTVARETGRGKT